MAEYQVEKIAMLFSLFFVDSQEKNELELLSNETRFSFIFFFQFCLLSRIFKFNLWYNHYTLVHYIFFIYYYYYIYTHSHHFIYMFLFGKQLFHACHMEFSRLQSIRYMEAATETKIPVWIQR